MLKCVRYRIVLDTENLSFIKVRETSFKRVIGTPNQGKVGVDVREKVQDNLSENSTRRGV